jgi:branched-chain amino acid transport system ATP-binding protein
MLETRNLSVFYGGLQALADVTVEVERGQIVSIMGANGAGKSTFLNAVTGLLKPRSGSIYLDGKIINHLEPHDIVKLGVSLVPEGRQIFSNLTVLENLLIGSYTPRARKSRKEVLEKVFDLFPPLKQRMHQIGTNLSGGEQQMLAIGRALMSQPRVILFDELSLGLSPLVVKTLYGAVKRINQEGITVILVEQDVKRSIKSASWAYVLQEGKVSLKGNPKTFTDDEVRGAYFGL